MPKPTNTQDLTARYLAAGLGFKPEEQFFALLNAASHVAKANEGDVYLEIFENFGQHFTFSTVLEPLADDKAPF